MFKRLNSEFPRNILEYFYDWLYIINRICDVILLYSSVENKMDKNNIYGRI